MIGFVQAFIALLPIIMKLLNLFIKSPDKKREELISELNTAFKKAVDEKDPSELSRIINR
jgi:hypothetical protein